MSRRNTPKPAEKHRTMVKLPVEVWKQGKAMAQIERRNFSNWIEVLIERERQRTRTNA